MGTQVAHELKLEMAGVTDKGLVRERNEDAIKLIPELGIAVLADGMGGHLAGDIASRMAVEVIAEELIKVVEGDDSEGDVLRHGVFKAFEQANTSIRQASMERPECRGMGATVAVCIVSSQVLLSHLGDSRIYYFAGGKLSLLTEDHTLAQQYVNLGVFDTEQARTWAGRNLLLKGLGIDPTIEPDTQINSLVENCIYLLCSDGLTDVVSDEMIAQTLGEATSDIEETAGQLVALANEQGGPDNISVILIRAATADPDHG